MNLQELTYFVAVAEHRHFGRAAQACHVSQPTLSGQLLKLEQQLGVTLFERNNRRVSITPVGEKILEHARRALEEAGLVESVAKTSQDQLVGPLKLGVIPTLAPYLIPLILGPLREAYPRLSIELWEDITVSLLERLRSQRLDAALLATEIPESDLTTVDLFDEPFLAALPAGHRLASRKKIDVADLADDLLVLADGHCLAGQARDACGRRGEGLPQRALQAASPRDARESGGGWIRDDARAAACRVVYGAARCGAAAVDGQSLAHDPSGEPSDVSSSQGAAGAGARDRGAALSPAKSDSAR